MITDALAVLALMGSGTTAGVLFAVAVSVVPALRDMAPDRYIEAHQLLGRNWDPTMPIIVLGTTVCDVVLAVMVPAGGPRALFAMAAALLFASSMVSHLLNVPLNREVKRHDPALPVPADWHDPRPQWRRWHLLRTTLAVVAFATTALAAVL